MSLKRKHVGVVVAVVLLLIILALRVSGSLAATMTQSLQPNRCSFDVEAGEVAFSCRLVNATWFAVSGLVADDPVVTWKLWCPGGPVLENERGDGHTDFGVYVAVPVHGDNRPDVLRAFNRAARMDRACVLTGRYITESKALPAVGWVTVGYVDKTGAPEEKKRSFWGRG